MERDWIIVVENKSDTYGFPSEVEDDPVLHMVTAEEQNYAHAEERRLFYVVVTRAKRGVVLLTPAGESSDFIREIEAPGYQKFVDVYGTRASQLNCPVCKGPTIRKTAKKDGGFFFACARFPRCNGTLKQCTNCDAAIDPTKADATGVIKCGCSTRHRICSQCKQGTMELRRGKYGEFWGCSQYGVTGCNNTQKKR